ncbi:glycosyltransferase [Immundisolibacter cernigliae]|uniref:Uncharacterized protein n=1 Tax=Immundisolibacter cernigliae TaxID=1810504 RepID=A0A1B1YRR4_9GAMM|nr:hypothetical protein PG2T_04230 [Immundisolibacter cernigliae]
MPALYQPLDVVAVMNTPGAFGDYSYPIKLYEAMACGRPVVASRTASTAHGICRRLRDVPDRLVAPGDAAALAGALVAALDLGAVDYGPQSGWGASGAELEAAMRRIGGRSGCGLSRWRGGAVFHRAAQLRSYNKEAPSPLPLSRERGMPSAGRRRGSIVGARLAGRCALAWRPCGLPVHHAAKLRSHSAQVQQGEAALHRMEPSSRRWPLGRRPAAVPLCGAAQVLLCGCLFAQLAETAPAERLLDALAQFVRFAKQAAGARLFRSFTFVVHVVLRCQHK